MFIRIIFMVLGLSVISVYTGKLIPSSSQIAKLRETSMEHSDSYANGFGSSNGFSRDAGYSADFSTSIGARSNMGSKGTFGSAGYGSGSSYENFNNRGYDDYKFPGMSNRRYR
ncbi:hypothetical protein PGB90_009173 [Kerria lacca]